MAKRRGGGSESKVGLIVTLILSLVLNLGLGITVYMYASAEDAKAAKIKELTAQRTKEEKRGDWYRFQSHLWMAYMGQLGAQDFERLRNERHKQGIDAMGSGQEDLAAVKKLEAQLAQQLNWPLNTPAPAQTFQGLVNAAQEKYKQEVVKANGWKDRAEKKDKELANLREINKANQDKYAEDLAKMRIAAEKETKGENRKLLEQQVTRKLELRFADEKVKLIKKADEDRVALDKELRRKDVEIRQLKDVIAKYTAELANLKTQIGDVPKNTRTDWKVVRILPGGNSVYVNLGYADKVKPQLTFSIHGVDLDGKPNPKAKGTLEIVRVVDRHLSKARITKVQDRGRRPILKGDVLFNPTWNPQLKKHVAIAGIIDLNGDGRDDGEEFRRDLKRHDVIVDAWLNTRTYEVEGKITVKTDYLIVGDSLELVGSGIGDKDHFTKIDKKVAEMQSDAKANGVAITSLRKYLELIGYRLPPAEPETPPAATYQPGYAPRRR